MPPKYIPSLTHFEGRFQQIQQEMFEKELLNNILQLFSYLICANVTEKRSLKSYVANFLQQRLAFSWLTQQVDHSFHSDQFQNLVVRSTFPVNLCQSDFEYYIDMTLKDFPSELKVRMKDLF
jgi:hypothetical protein